ncbi:TetR/AcrR family transcriptional regulator [Paenibacillus campi]|uniref:TetR/AcrR family transcriptional regulator n=1 Tax=Paenibacillus campi TaxID=3106031 RepID=UPI002AFE7181|nr:MULTISPECIES: TetR/AcrR family transcriptional regulator [unclassified Paenibacillus]
MGEKSNAKEQIINTAARLFFSQGYHATGLSQIIKESETPKGSLYHYFPQGKEELALVCIEKANLHVMDKFRETFTKHESTGDAIHDFVYQLAVETEAAGYTGFIPFSFWASVEASCISDRLRVACQQVFAGWQHIIANQLLQEGADAEAAQNAAILTLSMMEGALIISLTNQNNKPLLTAAQYLSTVMKTIRRHG